MKKLFVAIALTGALIAGALLYLLGDGKSTEMIEE